MDIRYLRNLLDSNGIQIIVRGQETIAVGNQFGQIVGGGWTVTVVLPFSLLDTKTGYRSQFLAVSGIVSL